MRILRIAAALVLLLGLTVTALAQNAQQPTGLEYWQALQQAVAAYTQAFQAAMTPLPACADLNNANLHVSDLTDAVIDGTVYCREIARDGVFLINPGAIGNQSVIERDVQQAYDVFGMTVEGVGVTGFNHSISVCLKGRGSLLFLPVYGSPRPVQAPQTYLSGEYTCARVGSPGVVALVNQGE